MNEKSEVAIIIPFYRDVLLEFEQMALEQCERVLSAYPKIIIKPQSLILPELVNKFTFLKIVNFEDKYFNGIKGYNSLMLSSLFYQEFLAYEYILIYQLDAFVFKDELHYWCNQDYDYIGAPWLRNKDFPNVFKELGSRFLFYTYTLFNIQKNGVPNKKQFDNRVGNGGFSLRRVSRFYELSIKLKLKVLEYLIRDEYQFNEDVFWSIEVNRKRKTLKIPSYKIGLKFSMEFYPHLALKLNNEQLPFGCHAWDKHQEFWRPIFKRFGYTI